MVAYCYFADGSHLVFRRRFKNRKEAEIWLKLEVELVETITRNKSINSIVSELDFNKFLIPLLNTLFGYEFKTYYNARILHKMIMERMDRGDKS